MTRSEAAQQIKAALAVLEQPDALTPDAEKVKKMSDALVKANGLLEPLQQAIYTGPDEADNVLKDLRNTIINFGTPFIAEGDTNRPIPDMTE
jgi:hypothetical protein